MERKDWLSNAYAKIRGEKEDGATHCAFKIVRSRTENYQLYHTAPHLIKMSKLVLTK